MKDCATQAYLLPSSLESLSNSTSALHVGEEAAPLPKFLVITAAGAPRPSLLSLGVDLTSKVMCQSRACACRITRQALICERLPLALPLLRRHTLTWAERVPAQVWVAYLQRQAICSLHGADSQRGGEASLINLIARNPTTLETS